MTESALSLREKPDGYSPPDYAHVMAIAGVLRRQRQPVIDRMWERKRARRGDWEESVRHIPPSYRKILLKPDLPQINDMINRVAGLIAKEPPIAQVMPPSGRDADVRAASKEEAALNAIRLQVADQQDRDPYAMGIDSQIALGESWLGVFPDTRRMDDKGYKRGEGEHAGDYMKRYKEVMADSGIPLRISDFDPQMVLSLQGDNERQVIAIVESDHTSMDLELGLGYKPIKENEDGKASEWVQVGTLSEPYVTNEQRTGETSGVVDTTHDRGGYGTTNPNFEGVVRKVQYFDEWTYQMYLDGVLVEEWEHDYGILALFPANGEQSSDRDPAWKAQSVIDPALAIAKQVIYYSAILASNAAQHGFPTPFLKNPVTGLIGQDGRPLTRAIRLGEMNLLGTNEEIEFPFLNAGMQGDFFRYMEYLSGTLESSTLSNFGKALGSDMAGYAIAQIRAQQMSVLAPVYMNARKQWRKIYYFIRFLVKEEFPAGIFLRGAIEEDNEGHQYRPIAEYSKKIATSFAIEVKIDEGIKQDELGERKSAIEMKDSGLWSPRRAMEHTGVEDPHAELQEIKDFRMQNSPAYDQSVLQLALAIVTERQQMVQDQTTNTPFMQALEKSKQTWMGGGGQFQNQEGAGPANAEPGGQPTQQQPDPQTQQGVGNLSEFGVPQMPGGVEKAPPVLV